MSPRTMSAIGGQTKSSSESGHSSVLGYINCEPVELIFSNISSAEIERILLITLSYFTRSYPPSEIL